ncbi:MAG: 16S rRNA (uracil(1498)-N(3))-methyltransferase [Pseudomonadota bacterium]
MPNTAKIRLYVAQALHTGTSVPVTRDQANYLYAVMRLRAGERILVFDGLSGEYAATVQDISKRGGLLRIEAQTRPLLPPPDLWLLFAPIKKARTDFIVEKAAEMGVARICPVLTEYTNSERIRRDRLQAHAIEAAEQCGNTFVPEVVELAPLSRILSDWPSDRRLIFADEARVGEVNRMPTPEASVTRDPWAVLIGPEGGFSPAERERLTAMDQVQVISLGPRILRADTAVVAALTLFQASLGDWR